MALPTEPTYSTYDSFKANTPVSSQKTIDEADWKPFALRAEAVLDTYVFVPVAQRYEEDQSLKFPIKDSNGASLIPNEVERAHIEITSDLILKGDTTAATGLIETGESWSSSQYSKNKQKKASSSSDDLKIEMPALARRLLLPWVSGVGGVRY
jgi:hypothetical protein